MKDITVSVTIASLVAIRPDGTHHIWSKEAQESGDTTAFRNKHEDANPGVAVGVLSGVSTDHDDDKFAFIFYVADCFSPPLYLVFGSSFQEAYDTFITEFEHLVKVEQVDLKDYTEETLNYNDNGTPVDTESVQYLPVASIIITDVAKASPRT